MSTISICGSVRPCYSPRSSSPPLLKPFRAISPYIDSELGDDIRGEDMARNFYKKGFTDITMATGYGPEKFTHRPWLKVTGKEPPWAA